MSDQVVTASDSNTSRQRELNTILVALQKLPVESADLDSPSNENPGWYNPTNRQALKIFISKYPQTEEGYQAETWLIFAQATTTRYGDLLNEKQIRAERAESLEKVISETTRLATLKMASLQRAVELHAAEEYNESEKQINEILKHIEDYKSESDPQFLQYVKCTYTPVSELEPTLRRMLIIEDCHQHHFEKALTRAKELKSTFPEWSERKNIDNVIERLERGASPYPTWEELKDIGRLHK